MDTHVPITVPISPIPQRVPMVPIEMHDPMEIQVPIVIVQANEAPNAPNTAISHSGIEASIPKHARGSITILFPPMLD
jgi:hypothetical protein